MYIIKSLLLNLALLYVFVAFFLYLAQEIVIFPRLISSKLSKPKRTIPKEIESIFAQTTDGEKIEIWTNHQPNEKVDNVAIIFHGNGETVEARNYMGFFEKVGIKSFTFDYRGTGLSSGWPSEKGLYLDAEAVHRTVLERTKLENKNIIILGNSLGSGPASYLASKIDPKGLILLSAYASMQSLAKERAFYKFFAYTVRYILPTAQYVSKINNSFLILAHGMKDEVIPFANLYKIKKNVQITDKFYVFESKESFHKGLYDNIEDELIVKTKEFLAE